MSLTSRFTFGVTCTEDCVAFPARAVAPVDGLAETVVAVLPAPPAVALVAAVVAAPRGAGACFTAVFLAFLTAFAVVFTVVTVPFPELLPTAGFAAVLVLLTLFAAFGFVTAVFLEAGFGAAFFVVLVAVAAATAFFVVVLDVAAFVAFALPVPAFFVNATFFAGAFFAAVFAFVFFTPLGAVFDTAAFAVLLLVVFAGDVFFTPPVFLAAVLFAVADLPMEFFTAVFFAGTFFAAAFAAAFFGVLFAVAFFAPVFFTAVFLAVDFAAVLLAVFLLAAEREAVVFFVEEAAVVFFLAAAAAGFFVAIFLPLPEALLAVDFFFCPVAILNNSLNIGCSLQVSAPEAQEAAELPGRVRPPEGKRPSQDAAVSVAP